MPSPPRAFGAAPKPLDAVRVAPLLAVEPLPQPASSPASASASSTSATGGRSGEARMGADTSARSGGPSAPASGDCRRRASLAQAPLQVFSEIARMTTVNTSGDATGGNAYDGPVVQDGWRALPKFADLLQASLQFASLPRSRRVLDQMSGTGGPELLGRISRMREKRRLFQR